MDLNDFPTMLKALSRRVFLPHPVAPIVDMANCHVIVTGTAPGSIGFETAKSLAAWGATVIITARSNPDQITRRIRQELQAIGITVEVDGFPLDLTDPASVDGFAAWYRVHYGKRLDVLVNNAGVHLDLLSQWKSPQLSADGFELHWRTNYLGPLHLTHKLLPLLKETGKRYGAARVVFVSSHLHSKAENKDLFAPLSPYNSWTAYGVSKLGLNHAAFELQRRFGYSHHLHGFALHPGSVYTNIADSGLMGNDFLRKLRNALAPLEKRILLTPIQGAQTTLYCATQPVLQGGRYYQRCAPETPSSALRDGSASNRLWTETEAWVNTLRSQSETQPATRTDAAHV